MAYIDKEMKKNLSTGILKVCKDYGVKGTLSIKHYSTLSLNISKGKIDFFSSLTNPENHGSRFDGELQLTNYSVANKHLSGEAGEFLAKVVKEMDALNYDNSEIMTDHHDMGYYTHINVGRYDKPYQLVK